MRSFVPASLVASATLFSAVQGVKILKPAAGETVDSSQGFDIVWEYDSSDPLDWEIELANPAPSVIATDVKPSSVASGQTAQYTYHVAPRTITPGNNWKVVLDPRNDGTPGTSLPESDDFTITNGGGATTTTGTGTGTTTTSTGGATTTVPPTTTPAGTTTRTPSGTTTSVTGTPSGSVVPVSKSTVITSASVISSTIVSGTFSTVVPQSTVFETTVVPAGGATATGSNTATSTGALHTGAAGHIQAGLGSAVAMALLPVFML